MPGMTGAQAVAEVQQAVGWRSDRVTEILATLNHFKDLKESGLGSLPWFLVTEGSTITTTTTTQEIAFPTDFIAEREEADGNLRYRNTSVSNSRTFFLKKMSLEAAEKYFFGDWQNNFDMDTTRSSDALSPGVPKAYVLKKSTIRVYPVPDAAYPLTWDYFARDTAITNAAVTTAWLTYAPWVLVGAAIAKIGADIEYAGAVEKGRTLQALGEAALMENIVRRDLAARPLRMGSRL